MRALSVLQQAFALQGRFPGARGALRRGRLVWSTSLQPTPLSRSYEVEIVYDGRSAPRVRVSDKLATRPGETLPHTYVGGWLCLHEDDDWNPAMAIADTIVSWTAEWLLYYEIWLATGEWHGGGVWPPRRDTGDPQRPDAKEAPPATAA